MWVQQLRQTPGSFTHNSWVGIILLCYYKSNANVCVSQNGEQRLIYVDVLNSQKLFFIHKIIPFFLFKGKTLLCNFIMLSPQFWYMMQHVWSRLQGGRSNCRKRSFMFKCGLMRDQERRWPLFFLSILMILSAVATKPVGLGNVPNCGIFEQSATFSAVGCSKLLKNSYLVY